VEFEVFLEVCMTQIALGRVSDWLCGNSLKAEWETYFFIDVDDHVVPASGHDALRGRNRAVIRSFKVRSCGLISCVGGFLLCGLSMLEVRSGHLM
jgi:hypothetical protein